LLAAFLPEFKLLLLFEFSFFFNLLLDKELWKSAIFPESRDRRFSCLTNFFSDVALSGKSLRFFDLTDQLTLEAFLFLPLTTLGSLEIILIRNH
jgi:hypothetical protein